MCSREFSARKTPPSGGGYHSATQEGIKRGSASRVVFYLYTRMAAANRLLRITIISVLTVYQRYVSPLLGPRCRFYPSCSDYAIQAFEAHSLGYGVFLTFKRLLKCHPGHPGGIDEVPDNQRDV